jgi:hypothetical protein
MGKLRLRKVKCLSKVTISRQVGKNPNSMYLPIRPENSKLLSKRAILTKIFRVQMVSITTLLL